MAKKSLTNREIEELYEFGSFKLTQERNDFLLPQIIDFVDNKKWMNLHPEYQRRLVWDRAKKSLFIESLIMNIPIPPVFLYEWEYGRYEVMDGQQRLSSIIDFYQNRFKLTGLEQWPDLNNRNFSELPPLLQKALDRRRISATVLLAESSAAGKSSNDLRKFIFERLNTGGQRLNAQELRNCIFAGKFNDLIIKLAGVSLFNDIFGIPRYVDNIRGEQISKKLAENNLFKRMTDCEIVLRFFAFRDRSIIKGAVARILDRCMEVNQNISEVEYLELHSLFISRLEACHEIFEDKCFKIAEKDKEAKVSIPLFDAVMVAVDKLYDKVPQLIKQKKKIQKTLFERLQNAENYDLITGRPGTAPAIKERADFIEDFLNEF